MMMHQNDDKSDVPIRRACASTSNRPLIRGILQTIQILKCYEDDDHDNHDHGDDYNKWLS